MGLRHFLFLPPPPPLRASGFDVGLPRAAAGAGVSCGLCLHIPYSLDTSSVVVGALWFDQKQTL